MKIRFTISLALILLLSSHIQAQTVYQAEDADEISQGAIESEHAGYTGTGYVNGDNYEGTYVEWAISMAESGEQTLTFYYASGAASNRNMQLTINGTAVTELTFEPTSAWTDYQTEATTADLSAGLNVIRLTSSTTSGGPNLDKMEITGASGDDQYYKLDVSVYGQGEITLDPDDHYYTLGSEVELTAASVDSFYFAGWIRDIRSKEATITHTIDTSNYLTALFMRYDVFVNTYEQVGWSTYNTETTGGAGGEVVTASNQSELESYAGSSTTYIIQIDTPIELSPFGKKIDVSSNKTITGINEDAIITGGGLRVKDASNVIISNLTIQDAYVDWEGKSTDNDAIEINNSDHVWVTHCDLSHFDDGLCDVKNGSDHVTVSWNHFHNHNKVMLIGSSDNSPQDVGHLNVTIHHNWFDGKFGNGIGQRMPRGRFGKIHVYNNYFNDVINSGAMAGIDADMRIDNNYFLNTNDPHPLVNDPESGRDNVMNASGNIYDNSLGRKDQKGTAFDPSGYYDYEMHDARDIPVIVMLGAGIKADTLIGREDTNTYDPPVQVDPVTSGTEPSLRVYPNPFRYTTNIQYTVEQAGNVTLAIMDISGRTVQSLVNTTRDKGSYTLSFDARTLSAGIYFCKLSQQNRSATKKIIIVE